MHLHVRQLEGDGLILDDEAAELLPLLGVVQGELVGGPGDPHRLRARRSGVTPRRSPSPPASRSSCPPWPGPGARRASPCRRAGSVPAPGSRRGSTSAVCEARMPIFLNFCPCEIPGVPSGTTNDACPRDPSSGSTDKHQHVRVRDAAVGDPGLSAVEHPLVLGLVVDGPRLQRGHVGSGVGLGHAERRQLDVVGRAEALRDPLADLLGRPVGEDPRHRQRGAEDGRARCRRRPSSSPR